MPASDAGSDAMHFNDDMRFICRYWVSLRVGALSELVRCCKEKGENNTLPLEASRAAAPGSSSFKRYQIQNGTTVSSSSGGC
jgi:hypothetical protein